MLALTGDLGHRRPVETREHRILESPLEAVAEDVTSRQVVPFLKRLAQAGS